MKKFALILVALTALASSIPVKAAYDANVGRWLSRDPIQESGGLNLYDYCLNNAIGKVDPQGLYTLSVGVSWSAAEGSGNGGGSFGFVVDTSGNIGTYGTLGGGVGIGSFFGLFVQAQVTKACTIKDLKGKNLAYAGEFGDLLDGSGEFIQGQQQDGSLYTGFGLSAGIGEGAALSGQVQNTTITPRN